MAIYHITYAADWQKAKADGEYRLSTKGRTLEQQGFIHASDLHQLIPTANFIYADDDDLLVLVIDTEKLAPGVEVKYEQLRGAHEPFPHIYGPLNADAVTDTFQLHKGDDGTFRRWRATE